jgi:hypothetical protein
MTIGEVLAITTTVEDLAVTEGAPKAEAEAEAEDIPPAVEEGRVSIIASFAGRAF